MVIPTVTPGGAQVLVPIRDKIRPLVDDLFTVQEPANPDQLAEEKATIEVLNGAGTVGVAAQMSAYLQQQGFDVVSDGNADRGDYANTLIIDHGGKPYTASYLASLLHVDTSNVRTEPGVVTGQPDIQIIVGRDFSLPTAIP